MGGVTYWYDDTKIGSEITATSSPDTYSANWDTTGVTDGAYTLYAVARDIASNYATTSISITIDNITVATVTTSAASSLTTTAGTLNGSISRD